MLSVSGSVGNGNHVTKTRHSGNVGSGHHVTETRHSGNADECDNIDCELMALFWGVRGGGGVHYQNYVD